MNLSSLPSCHTYFRTVAYFSIKFFFVWLNRELLVEQPNSIKSPDLYPNPEQAFYDYHDCDNT